MISWARLVGALLRDQADSTEDAENVRVERGDFLQAGEEKCARDRFRADVPETVKEADGFLVREICRKLRSSVPCSSLICRSTSLMTAAF